KPMLKKLLNLGFPSALQMLFEMGIFTSAVWLSGILGKNPQAANQIALNLASMTFMVSMGFSVTSMIRVGNQKGLKKYKDLRRVAISNFMLTTVLSVIFALGFIVFNSDLPKIFLDYDNQELFADNYEVVKLASQLLIIAAIFQLA